MENNKGKYYEGTVKFLEMKTNGNGAKGQWELWQFTIATPQDQVQYISVFNTVKGFNLLTNGAKVKVLVFEKQNGEYTNLNCGAVYKPKDNNKKLNNFTAPTKEDEINIDEVKAYCTHFLSEAPTEKASLLHFIAFALKKFKPEEYTKFKQVYIQKTQG